MNVLQPEPGLYRHYKGGQYRVLGTARHSENDELLVVGIGLVVWGYQMSGAVTAQLSRAISGAAPDGVMYRYIGGAAGIVAGVFLLFKRRLVGA